ERRRDPAPRQPAPRAPAPRRCLRHDRRGARQALRGPRGRRGGARPPVHLPPAHRHRRPDARRRRRPVPGRGARRPRRPPGARAGGPQRHPRAVDLPDRGGLRRRLLVGVSRPRAA
ncbi:MAG: hypothetical protein AVDCRST_MAG06-3295, partial [uncultured Nocardioides sp.]